MAAEAVSPVYAPINQTAFALTDRSRDRHGDSVAIETRQLYKHCHVETEAGR